MPLLRTLFAVASHLILFIARKVLSFLLPIPFFPAVSGVLANLVGLDPLTFKHPPFTLPPALTKLLPANLVPSFLGSSKPPFKALESGTIELGEKIRTWRQRDIVTGAERKLAEEIAELPGLSMLEKKKTPARPSIQNVEFDGSVPRGDLKPDAPRSEEIEEIQLPPPALETKGSPTQQDEPSELKDEDFAKLSAEKQVFEQTKKIVSAPVHELTSFLVPKSSAEEAHTEQPVPEDSILPQIHTFKAPFAFPITKSLPSDSPMKQAKSEGSSPDTHSTTSSVRLSTAVGEAAHVKHPQVPHSTMEHLKEEPYIDDTDRPRNRDSAPQIIKTKKDVKQFEQKRASAIFDSAVDMLGKLGPSKDWTGMPHTPEKDNLLLGLPKLM